MKKIYSLIRKSKLNNKGLSLIELIIAVTVLSLAIGPLLYSFVVSAKVNREQNIKQRATNAAQTIIENFKAYGVEKSYNEIIGNTFLKDNGGAGTFTGSPDNGTYTITGFSFSDAVEPMVYDATIEIKPAKTKDPVSGVESELKKKLITMEYMNSENDAAYEGTLSDNEILSKLNFIQTEAEGLVPASIGAFSSGDIHLINTAGLKLPTAKAYLTKISNIKLSRVMNLDFDASGNGTLKFTYNYSYDYAYDIVAENNSGVLKAIEGTGGTQTGSFNGPEPSVIGTAKNNVYFFYYPLYSVSGLSKTFLTYPLMSDVSYSGPYDDASLGMAAYNSTSVSTVSDKLVVTGMDTISGGFFLYKQADPTLSDIQLSAGETNYHLEGNLNAASVPFFHNLDEDISGRGGVMKTQEIAAGYPVQKLSESDYSTDEIQMLYTLRVDIMHAGETDVIATVTGTMYDHYDPISPTPTPIPGP